jgi:hypothetical protein
MIPDDRSRRTSRFDAYGVLPALHEALSQRPEWRTFSPYQLSVVLFLWGYLPTPPPHFDAKAALPFALEDQADAA